MGKLKAKKIMVLLLSAVMILSLAGCGKEVQEATETEVTETTETPEVTETEEVAASIDFEDGLFGFMGVDTTKGNADESVLSVEDFAGSKALKVTVSGKVPYIVLDVEGLLGDKISTVRTIEMDMGLENPDGTFEACSGNIYVYSGAENVETYSGWSVYLDTKNPNKISAVLDTEAKYMAAGLGNKVIITKEVDNGATLSNLYIDNIRFLDEAGAVIEANSSAVYVAPVAAEADMSNLKYLKNVVEFPGFATGADAWAQAGFDMPQEVIDALVPGSIIQIEYMSETGDMWLVVPGAAAGWMRVSQQTATKNNSKNIAQISFEEIAALCGDDVSQWGTMLQGESDGKWEIYKVSVGQDSGIVTLGSTVEFPDFATGADAWAQAGFDMPEEFIAALVPGSVIEIEYSSEMNNMWLVFPGAAAGWMRVQQQTAAATNSICQVTFEQIAEVCGDDVSQWGTMLQCESEGKWEVFAVRVGQPSKIQALSNKVEFTGFAVAADAWAQGGFDMPQEIIDALVPGSVVELNYTSDTGFLWLVMPDAAAGWMRVEQQTAECNGSVCQITYEQIAAVCGDDKTTWGARMQAESDGAWEVYSVFVGTPAE